MAAVLSPLEVFNLSVNTARTETIAQQVDKFNGASNNTLILTSAKNQGNFNSEAYTAEIAGLVKRRNQYADDTVSAISLAQLIANSVKIGAGTPPINIDPHWWNWINKSQAWLTSMLQPVSSVTVRRTSRHGSCTLVCSVN